MAAARWHGEDDDHGQHGSDDHGPRGGNRDGDDNFGDFDFDFELPDTFKIDFDNFNLKKLGKITDYDVSHDGVSVTIGKSWTFGIQGSDLDIELHGKHKLPDVTGGTIDSFTIDGPGKADFSISGLDMSAKDFYQALIHLDAKKLLNLVLGGDETISGTGFGDFLYGGDGNDTILGNKGHDWLKGGDGDDAITGGTGNDYLEGGSGADIFAFAPKSGHDLIADFDSGSDTIDLSAYGFSGNFCAFLNEHVRESRGDDGRCNDVDGDVVIDLGNGNAIKLEGVSRWELNADNVIL